MLISPPPSSSASQQFYSPPPPPCNLLRFAFSLCLATLTAQPRINIPFMSQQRFIPGICSTSQVSTKNFSITSVGCNLSPQRGLGTLAHAAGIYPLGRLLLGGWKWEAKAAVTFVLLINGR